MDKLTGKVSSLSIAKQRKNNSEDMECPICEEKATKKCSACKNVAYCSAEHQKLDWKNHKKVCQSFSIEAVEGMGMGWVATRDLKAGVCLLEEAPALVIPSWQRSTRTCSECPGPVCHAHCGQNTLPFKYKYKEFASQNVAPPPPGFWPQGMLTACKKVVELKASDPKKFKQLMSLQDFHCLPLYHLEEMDLSPGMFEQLTGPNSLTREEFRKFLRIVNVNADVCPEELPVDERSPEAMFKLYLKSSRINYSCTPNCTIFISRDPKPKRVSTILPVAKGEQLFMNYYEEFSFEPTVARQKRIRGNGFICKCKRCLDPTELGTFLSGIKCFNCSSSLSADSDPDGNTVGYFLPADPLDRDSRDTVFECHRCHIKYPFSRIMTKLPKAVRNCFNDLQQLDSIDEKNLENLLNKYEDDPHVNAHLHKNHWLIQSAMRKVIKNLMDSDCDNFLNMQVSELEKLLGRLQHLLAIDDKLFPSILYHPKYRDSEKLTSVVQLLTEIHGRELSIEKLIKYLQIGVNADKEELDYFNLEIMPHSTQQEKEQVRESLKWAEERKRRLERLLRLRKKH